VINAQIRREGGEIAAFTVANHGASHVCAAVSMLVINTINAIEALTDADFTCNVDERQEIKFTLHGGVPEGTRILLEAMAIGLRETAKEHPTELRLEEIS
jgi:uncharacterized protein YsxB (DUF464 family)